MQPYLKEPVETKSTYYRDPLIKKCIVEITDMEYIRRAGFWSHQHHNHHHYFFTILLTESRALVETQRPALHVLLQPLCRETQRLNFLMIDLSAKASRRSVVYLQAPEIMNLMSQQGSGRQTPCPASPTHINNRPRIFETPSPLTLRMEQYYRRLSNHGASKP
jgi:hypothetical protein